MHIRSRFPRLKILMFGMSGEEKEFIAAIRRGAIGYLSKDSSTEDILEAVRALSRNEAVIPANMSLALVEFVSGVRTYPSRSPFERVGSLTPREHQLVPLIERGLTNKEIAGRLSISEQTVKNHIRSILGKLNVKSRSTILLQSVLADLSHDPELRAG
jgi:two-component system NarL family response regulator